MDERPQRDRKVVVGGVCNNKEDVKHLGREKEKKKRKEKKAQFPNEAKTEKGNNNNDNNNKGAFRQVHEL